MSVPQQEVLTSHELQAGAHVVLVVVDDDVVDVTQIECPWNCWEQVKLSQHEVFGSQDAKEVAHLAFPLSIDEEELITGALFQQKTGKSA